MSLVRAGAIVCAVALVLSALAASLTVGNSAGAQAGAVLINELVAKNDTTLNDSDGDASDWIELRNPGAGSISLDGWTISDDAEGWTFPQVNIAGGGYLVIFASSKDRLGNQLHTNFRLSSGGETLTLRDDNGMQVDQLAFPSLLDDESFGRSGQGAIGLLASATPGQANSAALPPAVTLNPPPGQFAGSLSISMSAPGNAEIRYTTNGDAPNAGSTRYTAPFSVSSNAQVRAIAVSGGQVGPETMGMYTRVDADASNFSSNLPIVIVSSTSSNLDNTTTSTVTVIDNPNGRTQLVGDAQDTTFAGVRIRGASSEGFPKKQYKVELWDDWQDRSSRNLDLLGLGSESDWVLYAPGRFDRAMIQNPFVHTLYDRVGLGSSDHQFVELYLDDDGDGRVSANEYDGLYVLLESIKIGDERVDITKLDSGDNNQPAVSGGYIFTIDWNDDCCANLQQTPAGSYLQIKRPKSSDLTNAQESYASSFINDFEASLSRNFGAGNGVRNYLDVGSWIDDELIQIMIKEIDTGRASNYLYKDREGVMVKGPAWDFDRSLNSDDNRDNVCDSFGGLATDVFSWWWYGDLWDMPEFRALLYGRWHELREGPLSNLALTTLVDEMATEISEAYGREDDRWGNTNGYGSRYGGTLQGEITALKDWLICRVNFMDNAWDGGNSDVPSISNPGVLAATENQAFSRSISASDGDTIVFTASGLPLGLTIDELSGQITGTPLLGTAGSYQSVVTVTDSDSASRERTVTINVASVAPAQAKIVLNEYNAVGGPDLLDNNGSDAVFGRVAGNGGDWLELVTIEDELDITGWSVEMYEVDDVAATITNTDTFVFANAVPLDNLRAGSIITIAEGVDDDASYDPGDGDWTINLQANAADAGGFITAASQQNFDTNADGFFIVIKDQNGVVVMGPSGETESWDDANGGVSDRDVMVLCADPSAAVDRVNDYSDGTQSTFSRANTCPGFAQNLDNLRPVVNQAPSVATPPAQLTSTGAAVSFQVIASDDDGDAIGFTANGLPPGLTINPGTGLITGTASTAGVSTVTVTATDALGANTPVTFEWIVNIAPTLTNPGQQLSELGAAVDLSIAANEPDAGDALIWTSSGLPSGLALHASNGRITGSPQTAGSFSVSIQAIDRQDAAAQISFVWVINTPPTLAAITDRTNDLGNFVALGVSAQDADGDDLTFTAVGLPGGLAVNPASGSMSGSLNTPGTFTPVLTVTDSLGSSTSRTFTWTVRGEDKTASVANSCFAGNGRFDITLSNPGPGSATFTISVTGLPARNRSVGSGATIVETITGRSDGDYTISVAVGAQTILIQSETINCVTLPPTDGEIVQAVSCLAGNGRVDTNIVNTGNGAATYRIEFEGLTARQRAVDAQDWWRQPITGRADGTYNVIVKRDGVVVSDTELTVACDTEPPQLTTPEVQVVNACRAGNGYILVQFVNATATNKGYVIEFDGAPNRSTSAAGYTGTVRAITGRPDGTFELRIRTSGVVTHTISVTVSCD